MSIYKAQPDCHMRSIILRSFVEYALHKHNSLIASRTNSEHTQLSESLRFGKNLTYRRPHICIYCSIVPWTSCDFVTSVNRQPAYLVSDCFIVFICQM